MKRFALPLCGLLLLGVAFQMGHNDDGVNGISDWVIDKQIEKAGTSWPEIRSWVVKIRNVFSTFKAQGEELAALKAEMQELRAERAKPKIDPTPDIISTPDEKPLSDYAFALGEAKKTGQPLIVFVTASWCDWCHKLNDDALEPLRQDGHLGGVYYVSLDFDRDPEAKQIAGQSNLPVLMRYQFVNGKWTGKKLVGYKPKDEVLSFLKGSK